MILPVLVALLTALGPMLRGAWDLWAQSLLHLGTALGLTLWLASRILVGFVPLPSRRTLVWVALLAATSAASAWASPVHGLARAEWYNTLQALWLFPAMAALTKDERSAIDEAIRVSAWILMALAFYQRFSLGDERPASALVNQNVYAGAALMFLSLAAEKRDWLLALGLLWSLWWTRSVGAWLGLSLALVATQRRASVPRFWAGAAVAFVCAVALYGKLGTPDVFNRWWWWKAAAAMAADRPWTGYGPGSFAAVSPAFLAEGPGNLYTLYAHNYPLQTLAEFGLPFSLLWFGGLWRCVVRGSSHKQFGVLAVLVHSLWDYTLSMPSNLWLLSYFAASSIPDSPEGVNVPARHKLPALLVVAGLGLAVAGRVWEHWEGHRWMARAMASLEESRWDEADAALEEAGRRLRDDPQIPQMAAALEIRRAHGERGAWLQAAALLERSARLNPYRAATWTELELAYRKLGLLDATAEIERESRRYRR